MKIIPILSESKQEQQAMIALLRFTLKKHGLENLVHVALSPENHNMIHLIVDSTVTAKQEKILHSMQTHIKKHLPFVNGVHEDIYYGNLFAQQEKKQEEKAYQSK